MPSRSHNYESNGPEGRVRGNASQVYEKYLQLARDTQSGGDRVLAESFMQHAEHYYRVVNESTDPNNRPQHHREARQEERAEERDREDEEDQFNGYNGDQPTLMPARSVSRFDDRRQQARSGDPRYSEAKPAEQQAQNAAAVEEPPAPAVEAPAAEAEGSTAAAASTAVEGQDEKGEAEATKPVRRTRRSPTRRTTKSKTDETAGAGAAGGDEDAGLLKMLGETPRPNGNGAQTPEESPKTSPEASPRTSSETSGEASSAASSGSSGEKAAESPAEEAEAKPAPKPRRRRTTKSSSEAANADV